MTLCRTLCTLTRLAAVLLAATLIDAAPPALAATQKPIFPVLQYESYPVTSPVAMTEGDMNGDGTADTLYATASGGSTTLTPALRNGSAVTLGTTTTVATCTATSLLLADLDKDTKLDAVVACSEGTTEVLKGTGDGTFTAATSLSFTGRHYQATDLNGDGLLDLIFSTENPYGFTDSYIQIFINKSAASIAFATNQYYQGYMLNAPFVPGYSVSNQFVVADIDMDGKPDLLLGAADHTIANWTLRVLYGNGDGTFAARYPVDPNTADVAGTIITADFDGDGKLDVGGYVVNTTYSYGGTILKLYFPNSGKAMTSTTVRSGVVNFHPMDLNGDGKLDLLLTGALTTPLLGDGTGNFTVGKSYVTPGSFYSTRTGAKGVDIVYTTPAGYFVLHNDGTGAFDGILGTYFSDSPVVTDLNGDGLTDLAAAQSQGNVFSQKGVGDGTFSPISTNIAIPKGNIPVGGDFNSDGALDIVYVTPAASTDVLLGSSCCFGAPHINSYKGDGSGIFTSIGLQGYVGTSTSQSYVYPQGAVSGDFNGDGKLDIALSYNDTVEMDASGLGYIPGNGDGTFPQDSTNYYTAVVNIDIQPSGIASRPFAADLNNDGKLDLVWGHNAYMNQGGSSFTPLALPAAGMPLLLTDLNGDGKLDVLLDNAIYAGRGDGSFVATPIATITTPAGASLITASAGDLDGDGKLDLVIQSYNGMAIATVAYGDGTGNFTTDTNLYTTGTEKPFTASLARLNKIFPTAGGAQDYLAFASGAAMPLLNQLNPAPGTQPVPSISLVPFTSSVSPGASVSIQATVSSPYGTPTGTVTFTLSDGTALGSATLSALGATIQHTFDSVGSYGINATYSGDSVFTAAGPATTNIAVGKQQPSFRLAVGGTVQAERTSSLSTFIFGLNFTQPVTFYVNGQPVGTAAIQNQYASLNYVFPAVGTYTVTASYPGDAVNLPATSSAATVSAVAPSDFSLTVDSATATVNAGDKATWNLTVTPLNNYSGTVTLSCQESNCGTTQVAVTSGNPTKVSFSIQTTATSKASTSLPDNRFPPIAAATLLYFMARRKRRQALPPLLVAALFGVIVTLSGCSGSSTSTSGSSSASSGSTGSSGTSTSQTTSTFTLVGSDAGISVTHPLTLTLIVK